MTKLGSSVSEKPVKKKRDSTSNGLQTNGMSREDILRALKAQKPNEFYVWDGKDPNDKPLTRKEMSEVPAHWDYMPRIAKLRAELEKRDVFCRRVKVDVASHSPQMEPLREPLMQALIAGGVINGSGFTGYLELWPYNYGTGASAPAGVPTGNTAIYDYNDTPATVGGGMFG